MNNTTHASSASSSLTTCQKLIKKIPNKIQLPVSLTTQHGMFRTVLLHYEIVLIHVTRLERRVHVYERATKKLIFAFPSLFMAASRLGSGRWCGEDHFAVDIHGEYIPILHLLEANLFINPTFATPEWQVPFTCIRREEWPSLLTVEKIDNEDAMESLSYQQQPPTNPLQVVAEEWNSELLHRWFHRPGVRCFVTEPELIRVTKFRRFGHGYRFELLCHWKRQPNDKQCIETWQRYQDLIINPRYERIIRATGWNIEIWSQLYEYESDSDQEHECVNSESRSAKSLAFTARRMNAVPPMNAVANRSKKNKG